MEKFVMRTSTFSFESEKRRRLISRNRIPQVFEPMQVHFSLGAEQLESRML